MLKDIHAVLPTEEIFKDYLDSSEQEYQSRHHYYFCEIANIIQEKIDSTPRYLD